MNEDTWFTREIHYEHVPPDGVKEVRIQERWARKDTYARDRDLKLARLVLELAKLAHTCPGPCERCEKVAQIRVLLKAEVRR